MTPRAGRVVITGANGRLGSALVAAFGRAGWSPVGWTRRELDLDDPLGMADLRTVDPSLVVHAAAWTDVDGCARQPETAMRRNGAATGVFARACAATGVPLLLISTNEVFDGERTDGRGYAPHDRPNPPNPYGASKLAGETLALESLDAGALLIVRTAWLFGAGKPDFPAKIAAAARVAIAERRALRVVGDEIGNPTYVPDLAAAVVRLVESGSTGIQHVVNGGIASRAAWARDVLWRLEIDVEVQEIGLADFPRASTPPRFGVLAPSAVPDGPLRPWGEAMAERAAALAESAA